jgi:3-oxoacyl-[acyl-carrier protein] reductase
VDTQLKGLNVLITGASGGIGRALAQAFAQEGCGLALHAGRNLAALEAFASEHPWGQGAHCFAADVTDPSALEQGMAQARSRLGRIDIAVVNAGIYPAEDLRLHEMPVERAREVIEVNLLGAMWTARAFMQALGTEGPRDDKRGASICLIGSTAGRFGEAGHSAYAVSKAAMYGMLRTLKNELPHLDPYARINMVEPGWTVTPMAQAALDQPGTIERIAQTMPVRQLARPQDIARTVVALCSPGVSRHVSGEVVTVAGGMEGRVLWRGQQVDAAQIKLRLDQD